MTNLNSLKIDNLSRIKAVVTGAGLKINQCILFPANNPKLALRTL
jgi:hypothetical protein